MPVFLPSVAFEASYPEMDGVSALSNVFMRQHCLPVNLLDFNAVISTLTHGDTSNVLVDVYACFDKFPIHRALRVPFLFYN